MIAAVSYTAASMLFPPRSSSTDRSCRVLLAVALLALAACGGATSRPRPTDAGVARIEAGELVTVDAGDAGSDAGDGGDGGAGN
jgi:hypothetical protein